MKVYYFAPGLLLTAITSSNVFYIIKTDISFITMGTIITILSLILMIKNYEGMNDFFYFTLGITIYASINLLGHSFQNIHIGNISSISMALIFSIVLLVGNLFKKLKISGNFTNK